MKPKHQFSLWFKLRFFLLTFRYHLLLTFREARKYHFLWLWRFLFTWGWNGKKNTFSISFYQPDLETQIWLIGDY